MTPIQRARVLAFESAQMACLLEAKEAREALRACPTRADVAYAVALEDAAEILKRESRKIK